MADIDVGSGADGGTGYTGAPSMELDRTNPANAAGVLDTVQIRIHTNGTTINKVGTFYGSGTDWASRDYAQLGTLNSSLNTITGLSIDVVAGDILGHYLLAGSVKFYDSGKTGLCMISGMADRFDGTTYTYNITSQAGLGLSLYATGNFPIISITDTGAGDDSVGQISVGLSLSDTGAGADSFGDGIAAAMALTDNGSGADIVAQVAALLTLAESGAGVDAIGDINVSVNLDDSGLGADALGLISALLALADTGSGADIVIKYNANIKRVDITFTPKTGNIIFSS